MIATVYAVRARGRGLDHLTLHATPELALAALRKVAGETWLDRFGYVPAVESTRTVDDLVGLLDSEGWDAAVDELPVEL